MELSLLLKKTSNKVWKVSLLLSISKSLLVTKLPILSLQYGQVSLFSLREEVFSVGSIQSERLQLAWCQSERVLWPGHFKPLCVYPTIMWPWNPQSSNCQIPCQHWCTTPQRMQSVHVERGQEGSLMKIKLSHSSSCFNALLQNCKHSMRKSMN